MNTLNPKVILLTGVTGYIGGRLLKILEKENYRIRCLVRDPVRIQGRFDTKKTEVVQGNVLDKSSLTKAMQGVDTAFYMIHSMGSEASFPEEDRIGALNFSEAASEAGVKRIIYLGALGDSNTTLSKHLESRQEVGNIILANAKNVQVIEFRASIIIGSGSLSFEMIRALCERLPIMITPKWVWTMSQPIAIQDVLNYLSKAIVVQLDGNRIFEIGGREQISYGGIMLEYIRQRRLKRWLVPVPVLTPWLSSLWLGLVTPLYSRIGRKIIDSASYPTIVNDPVAQQVFGIDTMNVEEAIALALNNEDNELIDTHWSDAFSTSSMTQRNWAGVRFGNRFIDSRTIEVSVPPEKAFQPISRIGGNTGWYYANILWRLRGLIDRMAGGVGLRRGRRDPDDLRIGDSLDFWRVEAYEPGKHLLLHAEMKLPGRAWLEFKVEPSGNGAKIQQTAIFDPVGLTGILYWYILYPVHHFVFKGMIKGIGKEANRII